ncbi:MAG: hypothetical protein Q9196_004803 [Gyalolechia fulgens]
MPRFPASRVGRWLLLLFVPLITIFLISTSILSLLNLGRHGEALWQDSTHYFAEHFLRRDATPLTPVDYSLNLTPLDRDSPLVARAISVNYQEYVCKGERSLGMIINNPPSTHKWTEQDLDGVWQIRPGGSRTPLDLEAPLSALRIPHTANNVKEIVAGNQANKLRFIFRAGVVNDISRSVIDIATRSKAGEFRSPWPGRTFDMRTDDGKALLGTPHGIGIACLIADYSDVLGRKIPFARVFTADDYEDRRRQVSDAGSDVYTYPYYLLWELRDTATGDRPRTSSATD